MYCKHCGKLLDDDSMFCQHCGKLLDDDLHKKAEELSSNSDYINKISNERIEHYKRRHSFSIKAILIYAIICTIFSIMSYCEDLRHYNNRPIPYPSVEELHYNPIPVIMWFIFGSIFVIIWLNWEEIKLYLRWIFFYAPIKLDPDIKYCALTGIKIVDDYKIIKRWQNNKYNYYYIDSKALSWLQFKKKIIQPLVPISVFFGLSLWLPYSEGQLNNIKEVIRLYLTEVDALVYLIPSFIGAIFSFWLINWITDPILLEQGLVQTEEVNQNDAPEY